MSIRFPVVGPDVSRWANDMRRYMSRQWDRLSFRTAGQTASDDGVILWDGETSSPVVSRGGVWASISALSNAVYVSKPSQLSGTLDSTKIYIIDGEIDMGSASINVPETGLFIQGLGFGVSTIKTTEDNATLFSYIGAYSGDLFLYGVEIEASGAGSVVFDLDNDENFSAVECVDTNFLSCTSLGELTGYRQGLWSNVALLFCVDGLTMSGNWSGGFRATTSIIIGSTFSGTIFKEGTSLVVSGRFITDLNALNIQSGAAFCDFSPSNIANKSSFLVNGVSVNMDADAFPNMPESSVKARFSQCAGTPNTYVGGQWEVSSTSSTSTTANTPVKLAGTTTYSDMQWFTQSTDNAFVFDGDDDIGVAVLVSLSYAGTNNHEIKTIIRKWDSSASAYVDVATSGAQTMSSGNKVEVVSMHGFSTMSNGDRIEIWVENSNTGSLTAQIDGLVSIKERPS